MRLHSIERKISVGVLSELASFSLFGCELGEHADENQTAIFRTILKTHPLQRCPQGRMRGRHPFAGIAFGGYSTAPTSS